MPDKYLDKVYEAQGFEETQALYSAWSTSYDNELAAQGYATPGRIAEALSDHVAQDAPILDYGCGTGLSGVALSGAGFAAIDGADINPDMLRVAEGKGVYRALHPVEPGGALPEGPYRAMTATGVIGAGAAPLSTFDLLMRALPPGGHLAFSFNDHTLSDPAYEAHVNEWVDCGAARLLHRKHGDHLPGIGLSAAVYVLLKH